ncbi:ABC transporter substrate-binding protein [Hymenobacter sediminicola]|uniref:ABC transporter substrate-binding protein n=1 Tax=Hymenobacter sediminicola TaxID=2761579 RepID=A0A7G7W9J4_9BACT|nr:ABC transporter substrate-binding protein [Hymenobacter sediminicola]QNH63037.1 ABC transporter substrate-binding protein [Hymenobacter sediminicola]
MLTSNPEQLKIVPWLAEALPQISRRDSLTRLTYQLRAEATWDNGQPVLARDVAFTLRVMHCPGLPTEFARTQYGFVQEIELDSTDPKRFTLVCSSSSPDIVLASGDYSILPEYALDPSGALRDVPLALLRTDTTEAVRRHPALRTFAARYRQAQLSRHPDRLPGCGPYRLTSWESNRYMMLERKSGWWASRLQNQPPWLQAKPERLAYQIIPDNTTALLALRRGSLDLYPMPTARDFTALRASADTARLAFYTADSYDMLVAGFNTQRPMLRTAATRRALSLLFNIPDLMQATHQGLAYRSVSLINPHDRLAYQDSLPDLVFSLNEAKRQLRLAGWQLRPAGGWWNGNMGPLALHISYHAGAVEHETVALQFQAAAARIGVAVQLRPAEASLLQRQLVTGDMDMFVRKTSGNPFGYNFMPLLHTRGIGLVNYSRFSQPAADRLIEAITAEPDPQRHARLLKRFQVLLRRESPLVVLYFTRNRLITTRRMASVRMLSVRPGYDVLSLQLDSTKP